MSETERLKALRSDINLRVSILCLESGLFNDVTVERLNTMLNEIKAAVIRCKPDPPLPAPPGMIK